MINLHVITDRPPIDWDLFRQLSSLSNNYSIALDGFVYGKPMEDINIPCANYNHHEEVLRLCTRSTCEQVLLSVRMG